MNIRQHPLVKGATDSVNEELQKLAHDFSEYEVKLDSSAIQVQQFIDSLRLGASTSGASVMLGGDGRFVAKPCRCKKFDELPEDSLKKHWNWYNEFAAKVSGITR